VTVLNDKGRLNKNLLSKAGLQAGLRLVVAKHADGGGAIAGCSCRVAVRRLQRGIAISLLYHHQPCDLSYLPLCMRQIKYIICTP
jgi:hypothetical protein